MGACRSHLNFFILTCNHPFVKRFFLFFAEIFMFSALLRAVSKPFIRELAYIITPHTFCQVFFYKF